MKEHQGDEAEKESIMMRYIYPSPKYRKIYIIFLKKTLAIVYFFLFKKKNPNK